MPYDFDPDTAPAQDLTSLAWARWVFVDRTGAGNLSEAQIDSRLRLHVRLVDGVTYWRPLAAAADYVTRPDQMVKRGRNDLTDEYIDPFKVAAGWRDTQAQLDTQIPAPASGSGNVGEFTGNLDFPGWGS